MGVIYRSDKTNRGPALRKALAPLRIPWLSEVRARPTRGPHNNNENHPQDDTWDLPPRWEMCVHTVYKAVKKPKLWPPSF